MQETASSLAALAILCSVSTAFAQAGVKLPAAAVQIAAAPAGNPPATGSAMAATIGELVRLEAEKALEEARKASNASAPAVTVPAVFAVARPKVVNTDVIELLGTYSRSGKFAADLAINGVVMVVRQGDLVGVYEVTGVANNCIHLLDAKKERMLRCILNNN
jgi:hypothetical protein